MSFTTNEFDEKRDPLCHRCNVDRHMCPGCGEPLPHGTEICDECDEALNVEEFDPDEDCPERFQ